jgi:hypothetical protein
MNSRVPGNRRATMGLPTVHIETLQDPRSYSAEQIEQACRLAQVLGRGRFVLAEPPEFGSA